MFPREWPARVVIDLADGRSFENLVRYPKGDPQNPLTWDELAAKFRSLTGGMLSTDRCNQIIEQITLGHPAALAALCC